jgi:hypothetical protein
VLDILDIGALKAIASGARSFDEAIIGRRRESVNEVSLPAAG